MRLVSAAACTAAFLMLTSTSIGASAQTSASGTTRSASSARRRAATAKAPASVPGATSTEGLAAVGSMPAVTGPVKTLFSLRYVDLKIGTGEPAETRKFYTVHYTGWTTDGKKFDSSFDHEGQEPLVFPVGVRQVIIGWDTGFEGMRVGGKRRIIVPYQLAYGERGRPPVIPAKADLIFDVELLAQNDEPPQKPAAPATPPPSTPPAGAAQPQATPSPSGSPASTEPTNKPEKPE